MTIGQTQPSAWRSFLSRAARALSPRLPSLGPGLHELRARLAEAAAYDDEERFRSSLLALQDASLREKTPLLAPMALESAASFGRLAYCRLLLEAGADPNGSGFSPPIHRAVELPDPAILQLLLRSGANPNPRDANGSPPLSKAAENGLDQHAALLIKTGASLDAVDSKGLTPLDRAIHRARGDQAQSAQQRIGALLCAELLIEAGAKPLESSPAGLSPICLAASLGLKELAERLLAREPDPAGWLLGLRPPQGRSTPDSNFAVRALGRRAQIQPLGSAHFGSASILLKLIQRAEALAEAQALSHAIAPSHTPIADQSSPRSRRL